MLKQNQFQLLFKSSIRKQLYALYPLIIFTITIIIGVFVLIHKYGIFGKFEFSILAFIYAIFFIPVLILHIEYLTNDRKVSLLIDMNRRQITYQRGLDKTEFFFTEVEIINFYGETKSFNNLTTQNYSFYNIILKNRKTLLVTCFVIRDLEEILPKMKITKNRRLFPSIMYEDDLQMNLIK